MRVTAIASLLKGKGLEEALLDHEAVVLDPAAVGSMGEIQLADHLAKKSMKEKRNIARKRKYEFLLWLTGKTDLKSAFRIANPKGQKMLLVIFSGDEKKMLDALKAKTQDTKLKTQADPLALERISLSRIKN